MIQTKLIATLGPASGSPHVVTDLIRAGVNVFRLNFSHGSNDQRRPTLDNIRRAADELGAFVAVMGDLTGPKIRLGVVDGGPRTIETGATLHITRSPDPRGADRVGTNYPPFIDEVRTGHAVLIDDGLVRLRAVEKRSDELICTCEVGGKISDRKGVNLPDTPLSMPSLTEKDERDLLWAVENELDYVALSFVRKAADIEALRDRLRRAGRDLPIVAKLEKPEAIERISEIIDACDVLMVARGDLGVEMDVARVPIIQKDIVRRCAYAGRPVIVATQMLQSMIENSTPTRAEVSDVANAILDGADAVMLSAETAVGRYPVETVRMMRHIAEQTEPLRHRQSGNANMDVLAASMRVTSAVARGVALLARDLSAQVVAVWTKVGNTPRLLSKHALSAPLVGLSPDAGVCRRMALYRGVVPVQLPFDPSDQVMMSRLDAALIARGLAAAGDTAIVVPGTQLTRPGSTNSLLIHVVAGT